MATALVIDLWCSYSTHPITQHFAFSPLLSFLLRQKHFPKQFVEQKLLKSHKHRLVIWQTILWLCKGHNQPFSIITSVGSICSKACLWCTGLQCVTPRRRTSFVLSMLPPQKDSIHRLRNIEKWKVEGEKTPQWLFFYIICLLYLFYSEILEINTTDGGWILKAY